MHSIDSRNLKPVKKNIVTAQDKEEFRLSEIQERWKNLRSIWKQSLKTDAIDPTTLPSLTKDKIVDCITILNECQKTWQIERQILIYLNDMEVHKHPSVNMPSFGQFLSSHFDKTTYRRYIRELAHGRREQLLGLPIATYSRDQFIRLERFRCFVPVGSMPRKKGGQLKVIRAGTKIDYQAIERMKECWSIACNLAQCDRPKTEHIEAAAEEMNLRYPGEYPSLKPRNSLKVWKERAIAFEKRAMVAESRVQELEVILEQQQISY
jgi:hypothetical protein